jgi:acetyltransferase-like isoleucine patch superfamily enzyme
MDPLTASTVDPSAVLGSNVSILSQVWVSEHVWIGGNVILGHPRAGTIHKGFTSSDNSVAILPAPVHVGAGCIIRSGTILYEGVQLGTTVDIAHNVLIREDATLGDGCYIMPNSEIHAEVRLGEHVRFRGFACNRAIIEDGASMLGMLVHDYRAKRGGVIEASPVVGRGAIVGMNAVVIGGVRIGECAIVGAGAVVTRDIPPASVAVGNPAQLHNIR